MKPIAWDYAAIFVLMVFVCAGVSLGAGAAKIPDVPPLIWFGVYCSYIFSGLFMGIVFGGKLIHKGREVRGLRATWTNKDIDELQERIAKLEEDLDELRRI